MKVLFEPTATAPQVATRVRPVRFVGAGAAAATGLALVVAGYAALLIVAATGRLDAALLAPLALTTGFAAFALPSGFRIDAGEGLVGLGIEFVAMPWVAVGLVASVLGWLWLRRPVASGEPVAWQVIAAFAATFAVVVGLAAALTIAALNEVWRTDIRVGADAASLAARAFVVAGVAAAVVERRHRPERTGPLARYLDATLTGVTALVVVTIAAGAVAVAAATDGLVPGERLAVVASSPLTLVNLGAMALGLVVGAPVSGGVGASVGTVVGLAQVGAADLGRSLGPGDRTVGALVILAAVVVVVVVAARSLLERAEVRSIGEGLRMGATLALGFAAAGWLVATFAAIDVEAFSLGATATRSVVGLTADVETSRLLPGLFVPALAASVVAAGVSGRRSGLPLIRAAVTAPADNPEEGAAA